MADITLKALYTYLRILGNAAEIKRKTPASSTPRTLKDGLLEISKLVGVDAVEFRKEETVAALIGGQRFVMMGGEASVNERVLRICDGTRALVMVLIDPTRFDKAPTTASGSMSGSGFQEQGGKPVTPSWASVKPNAAATANAVEPEMVLESLKPLLAGNLALTARLYRALFEQSLAITAPVTASSPTTSTTGEFNGSKEHGRCMMSTAMYVLGSAVAPEGLDAFMAEQGLFSLPLFEHLLQHQDFCDAFYSYRHLERAFIGTREAEEAFLQAKLALLTGTTLAASELPVILSQDVIDKATVDAHVAAADVLESVSLTALGISMRHAAAMDPSHLLQSLRRIAQIFLTRGKFQDGKILANQEIVDHLLAFGRQFAKAPAAPERPVEEPVAVEAL